MKQYMGQYFYILNLDKRQFLHPHCFGDGLKLLEFGSSANGTMTGLALLLRKSTEGGGGDYTGTHEIVGSWAGDRIAIVGDYDVSRLFQEADESWINISHYVLDAMKDDRYLAEAVRQTQTDGMSYFLGGLARHKATEIHQRHPLYPRPKVDIEPVPTARLFQPGRPG